MPIYEYHCSRCGRGFELLVRGDTAIACPACGSASVERTISLPAPPRGAHRPADYSSLGPPRGGSCCSGGGCGCH